MFWYIDDFVEIENIKDLFDVYVIMWVEISDEIYE